MSFLPHFSTGVNDEDVGRMFVQYGCRQCVHMHVCVVLLVPPFMLTFQLACIQRFSCTFWEISFSLLLMRLDDDKIVTTVRICMLNTRLQPAAG